MKTQGRKELCKVDRLRIGQGIGNEGKPSHLLLVSLMAQRPFEPPPPSPNPLLPQHP